MTHNLRAWICFYRVRHSLLRKRRSWGEDQTLKDWGTKWRYALETFDFFQGVASRAARCFPTWTGHDLGNSRGRWEIGIYPSGRLARAIKSRQEKRALR
jgi:hypothetical protein